MAPKNAEDKLEALDAERSHLLEQMNILTNQLLEAKQSFKRLNL